MNQPIDKPALKKAILEVLEPIPGIKTWSQKKLLWTLRNNCDSQFNKFPGLPASTLREVIAEMVEEGVPILSGQEGYWLSSDWREVDKEADRFAELARSLRKRSEALRRTAMKMKRGMG